MLEVELGTVLDFGGIRTEDAATALRRARKGALLNGSHALGVAGLVDGAANLQRLLGNARHACRGTEVHAQIAGLVEQYASSSPVQHFLGVIECQIRSLMLEYGWATRVWASHAVQSIDIKLLCGCLAALGGALHLVR